MRIRAQYLYMLVMLYAIILFSSFIFGDSGIVMIEKKHNQLEQSKEKIVLLKAEINQINIDIQRFQKDKEYLISSAKIYGYLEDNKEKIVRIINDESLIEDN